MADSIRDLIPMQTTDSRVPTWLLTNYVSALKAAQWLHILFHLTT